MSKFQGVQGAAEYTAAGLTLNDGDSLALQTDQQGNLRTGIFQGNNQVAVQQFHNADNQNPGATAYGLLAGGVAQIVNTIGNLDRQTETGFDNIPAKGLPAGSQQLAVPFSTTDTTDTFAPGTRTFTPVSMAHIFVGSQLTLDTGANQENVVVTAVTATTFTCVTTKTHTATFNITGFYYNQARDASIGDNVQGTGVSPSATYLWNGIAGVFELDRSANGEKDGASGAGTAVAAEYEFNGTGPLLNTGFASGLAFDRARNLQGKGVGTATQSAGGAAGATSITVSSAAATNSLQPGQQIRIDRNTGTEESAYVATNYVPGTAVITLQSALQFTHTAAAVEWDIFASAGPGLNGFTPTGLGIEEEALYNPVDGKYYIERSASQDGMPAANIVAESGVEWNGSSFDRARTPGIWKTIAAVAITAGTPVAVWTPAAGKKFRVMGFALSSTVAGSIILKDNTTEWVRTPTLLAATPFQSPPNMDNGYLSTTVNNALNLDVTASGTVSGFVFGTEE